MFVTLDGLNKRIAILRKLYDGLRLVDPLTKEVIRADELPDDTAVATCYDHWQRGSVCDNCISMRAHRSGKCLFKIEQSPDEVLMIMSVPIKDADRPLVLELLKDATDSVLMDDFQRDAEVSIRQMVDEMNARVVRDPLTGLYNRRYIDERLPADMEAAQKRGTPISVAFVDVDRLKLVNDTYGHAAGDRLIREVAERLRCAIRGENDWVARYGGDEFLICLNNADAQQSEAVAERIRQDIAAIQSGDGESALGPCSVSIGVYCMSGVPCTPQELIERADRRMYLAKRAGCNCVVCGD